MRAPLEEMQNVFAVYGLSILRHRLWSIRPVLPSNAAAAGLTSEPREVAKCSSAGSNRGRATALICCYRLRFGSGGFGAETTESLSAASRSETNLAHNKVFGNLGAAGL
jgi:hypothetical protein